MERLFGVCRPLSSFETLGAVGEGTYGTVFKARDVRNGEFVALKKVTRHQRNRNEGFPLTSLREIILLGKLNHRNVVKLLEVCVGPTELRPQKNIYESQRDSDDDEIGNSEGICVSGSTIPSPPDIYLVFEYCEHDVAHLLDKVGTRFSPAEVKSILQQLLRAVNHLHENWVTHRDIKAENLLLTNQGEIKLADFGLARNFGSPALRCTANVVTVWYRAPELLFGLQDYSSAIDIWSVGCVFGELISGAPLLPGKDEAHQVQLICELLGTPSARIWPLLPSLPFFSKFPLPENRYNNLAVVFPDETPAAIDLLNRMLIFDPSKRITTRDALRHPYFSEKPHPKDPSWMPTWRENRMESMKHASAMMSSGDRPRSARGPRTATLGEFGRRSFLSKSGGTGILRKKNESLTRSKNVTPRKTKSRRDL